MAMDPTPEKDLLTKLNSGDLEDDRKTSDDDDVIQNLYPETKDDIELSPPQKKTTLSILFRLEENRKKNWFSRNFSPISKGGIRSSVLTLFSGTVGAGVLSLPKVKFNILEFY